MLICKECKNVYLRDSLKNKHDCPRGDCNGRLVDIDDALVPIIQKLWNSGIVTTYCCSGHPATYASAGDTYIIFDLEKSGTIVHEEAMHVFYAEYDYDPHTCPNMTVEYMPVLNKYMISLHYDNYHEWTYNIQFLASLAKILESNMLIFADKKREEDITEYFYKEYMRINSHGDAYVTFRIGLLIQSGDSNIDDECNYAYGDIHNLPYSEYWALTDCELYTMHGGFDDETKTKIPAEYFEINNEIDFETFKKFSEVIKNTDEIFDALLG